ncbi:MAG TPA: DNA polymerase II large subunit [Thermoplasmata archaeon]|nr:DNA polymerase II large subunit [Thermoplasmata archaeon]
MDAYDQSIRRSVDRAYTVAQAARAVGVDPTTAPEIPLAEDMAMRVEKLLGHLPVEGIAAEIRELAKESPRDEVAIAMARRIARDPKRGASLEARVDAALRVGLAILTEGILVAPLEGLAEVHLRNNGPEGPYLELYYAGPIRAAGGTAQAMSVVLADAVRRDAGLAAFRANEAEVGRYKEEIPLYKHLQHLQYVPSAEEIEVVARHLPVAISGESTEGDEEVSAFRDLPRVETNGIRGGACLVIAEGLCLKAPKLRKVVEKLGLPGWEFLSDVGRGHAEEETPSTPKYLSEAVAGRPVLAHPNRPGGFRLTYGRARTTGLAATAVNPATMVVLRKFVAIGTQIKLEYPGKASAIGVCDTIDGPIVELDDGTLTAVHDVARAEALLPHVRRVVDLGALLVPFGEFLENNRPLVPGAFDLNWYFEELRAAGAPPEAFAESPSLDEAIAVARRWNVPLHPKFLLFWHDLTTRELTELAAEVEARGSIEGGSLRLPWTDRYRDLLVRLGFLHARDRDGRLAGEADATASLLIGLGLAGDEERIRRQRPVPSDELDPMVLVSTLAGVGIRARAPSRVGARVGRPEKARQRMLSPNVHVLFPVGEAGGARRSIPAAARSTIGSGVSVALGMRRCPACDRSSVWSRCACGSHTEPTGTVTAQTVAVAPLWAQAVEHLHLQHAPETKGVKGLTSPGKVPELLEKGILRALHGVSVYQDGTARFDLTDMPLTHFRPREAGLSVEQARALGYATDWTGAPLEDADQLVELCPQDLIVARACGAYLLRIARFVDDELVRLYGQSPFYRARAPDDLIGQIVVALAPHTSGGVAGRIIGFTEAEACFAHPAFHAAKRRNCDGDEDSVTLLLDALVNFSRAYLPESRGGLMDKPLVLTTHLDLAEVDKEAHNVDVAVRYPLGFYRAAAERRHPKEVERSIETLGRRLGAAHPLHGLGFTHDTTDVAGGPVLSAYREAGSMNRIVELSIALAAQIRAVDVGDAVSLVLNSHFLPDVMGNLKSYATQRFRCKVCNTSYRRPPLSARCAERRAGGGICDGELLATVHEANVRKYIGLSQRLAATGGVPEYLRQRIAVLEASLATLFPGAPEQTTLDGFEPSRSRTVPPTSDGPPNT